MHKIFECTNHFLPLFKIVHIIFILIIIINTIIIKFYVHLFCLLDKLKFNQANNKVFMGWIIKNKIQNGYLNIYFWLCKLKLYVKNQFPYERKTSYIQLISVILYSNCLANWNKFMQNYQIFSRISKTFLACFYLICVHTKLTFCLKLFFKEKKSCKIVLNNFSNIQNNTPRKYFLNV